MGAPSWGRFSRKDSQKKGRVNRYLCLDFQVFWSIFVRLAWVMRASWRLAILIILVNIHLDVSNNT